MLTIDKLVSYPIMSEKSKGTLTIPIKLTEKEVDKIIKLVTEIIYFHREKR